MATLYAAKVADSDVKTTREKKPRTEKQIAALEKATAARKRKREEADKKEQLEIEAKSEELEEANRKLAEVTEKKRLASEKRKATLAAKKASSPKAASPVKQEATVEVKKVEEETPPPWFKKFIQTGIQQRNQVNDVKQPQKSVRIEAKELADQKWSQPKVRDLVNKNMETHYDKMYNQIFCGRGVARG